MFINNFDPVAFQVMSFEIRWYSLAYILGIIIGWILCKRIFIKDLDINQRNEMLSGISHDLRTPLTRMKLQIAFITDKDLANKLSEDINEMEKMLNE